jgi:hypothetical protein
MIFTESKMDYNKFARAFNAIKVEKPRRKLYVCEKCGNEYADEKDLALLRVPFGSETPNHEQKALKLGV